MTTFTIVGGTPLRGTVRVPGDKSISHRALLLGALAEGTSTVRNLSTGDDVARSRAAVEAMGAHVERDGNRERISGGASVLREPDRVLDVGNSGTSIRLLAGMCARLPWLTVLEGDASIAQRPMDRVAEPLRRMGAFVDGRGDGRYPPLVVRGGRLRGIEYDVPMASAQVKSAVLLAGLGAAGETVVREISPTRAHTEEMLAACGADIAVDGLEVRLRPSELKPFELDVPGDPSQAAFWVVAACTVSGSDVTVEGVYLGAARTGFLDALRRMGADIEVDEVAGTVRARSSELRAADVSGAEIPGLDEIPVLAVAAARAKGTTTFTGIDELVIKESNRLATISSELAALGGRVEGGGDRLVVHGPSAMRGGALRSHGDHRIAMAMAVAALGADGETTIDGWDAVATSYPEFGQHLERLRGG
ncbi:MAG: 3-phosphoshikimate 1-carboxyvinyltransferase [Actinobacteria bacterium]|nr:MAG: 3-phosphoshikimate 1-carboxyvinyltransferase [Actinomycetota bacterium]